MGRDDIPRCSFADCGRPLAKRTRGEYCDDHTCELTQCGEKKDDRENRRYCKKHACRNLLCTNSALAGEDFCDDHEGELCHISGCHRKKDASSKSDYCADHVCEHYLCNKAIRSVDDDNDGCCCADHSCHALSGCDEQAVTVGGFCEEHECGIPKCHTRKKEGFTYCADHKCHSNWHDCEEPVLQFEGLFCEEHTCQSDSDPNCFEERVSDFYCDDHTCQVPGCDRDAPYSWTQCCYRHCCNWKHGCEKQRVEEDHCADHGCVSCSKIVYEDSKVCEEHKCKVSECINEKVSDGEHCEDHTC